MIDYRSRERLTMLDGTTILQCEEDRDHEAAVAAELGEAFSARLCRFAMLSPIDWYAERDGRIVGLVEAKWRSHASTRYPTVFLNLRKFLALTLAGNLGHGVPGIFAVKWEADQVLAWIPVAEIPLCRMEIAGMGTPDGRDGAREPILHVPIEAMRKVATSHRKGKETHVQA